MPSSTSNSEVPGTGKGGLAPVMTFFDPEHVDRPVPDRPWRVILFVSLIAVIALTAIWEVYWRGKGYFAGDYKNNAAIWAQERNKVKGDSLVFLGSSRIFYDVNIDIWEELSGERPIQLPLEGTSPRFLLKQFAEDETFHGTLAVGVTSFMFWTEEAGFREDVVKYWEDESPSQKVDHKLSQILDRYLAFIDDQTRPKSQVRLAKFPMRENVKVRYNIHKMETLTADRGAQVWQRLMDDEAYRDEIRQGWLTIIKLNSPPPQPDGSPPPPMPDEAINAVIAEVKANIDKIRARGGDVAFIQPPYAGIFTEVENGGFPRERFWDRLLAETDCAGVTFLDHPEMQGLDLPEWSHLSPDDAKVYTRALVPAFYAALEKKKAER